MSITTFSTIFKSFFFFFGLLASSFYAWSDSRSFSTVKQAERLFAEKFYDEAIPLYSSVLSSFPFQEVLQEELQLRLCTCFLQENDPEAALQWLIPLQGGKYRATCLYLMSLAHRQLGQSRESLQLLHQCTPSKLEQSLQAFLLLEKGHLLLALQETDQARDVFLSISFHDHATCYGLAQLQLAKMQAAQGNLAAAREKLAQLALALPTSHPLQCERQYLEGCFFLDERCHEQAAACFKALLDAHPSNQARWTRPVAQALAITYLRQTLDDQLSASLIQNKLNQAERLLRSLLTKDPNARTTLLLCDVLLAKSHALQDAEARSEAQQLLNRQDFFPASLQPILQLKRATFIEEPEERLAFYRQLLDNSEGSPSWCGTICLNQGLQALEEGIRAQKSYAGAAERLQLQQATQSFAQAVLYYRQAELSNEWATALQALALTQVMQGTKGALEAWQTLQPLLQEGNLLSEFKSKQILYALSGWIALHVNNKLTLEQALEFVQRGQAGDPNSQWAALCLKLEGWLHLQLGNEQEADHSFASWQRTYPQFAEVGEAWYWRALAHRQDPLNFQRHLQQVYIEAPQSVYAAAAYFYTYSPRLYLNGSRKVMKHLEAMPSLFPNHPLLITAYYLMGLDRKKDHVAQEAKWVRRKDLIAAIEAFQRAESLFDDLVNKTLIPANELSYFAKLRCRAQLERALTNLAIAKHSEGGKRCIYLNYAREVFDQLRQTFEAPPFWLSPWIADQKGYPSLWAEAEFYLAQTQRLNGQAQLADATLDKALHHFANSHIAQDHWLMRTWQEKGKLAQDKQNFALALQCLTNAEKAALNLSESEILNLWIEQSQCCKEMGELNDSMRLLSKVINADAISPLRLQAMFLRAEVYELQGRPELALKQLEAIVSKGGKWAQLAQQKLEKLYERL